MQDSSQKDNINLLFVRKGKSPPTGLIAVTRGTIKLYLSLMSQWTILDWNRGYLDRIPMKIFRGCMYAATVLGRRICLRKFWHLSFGVKIGVQGYRSVTDLSKIN